MPIRLIYFTFYFSILVFHKPEIFGFNGGSCPFGKISGKRNQ